MNVTQANPTPYKKTSIKISDISPKAPKVELFKIQKKSQQGQQISSQSHAPLPQYFSTLQPSMNSVLSASSLPTVSFCAPEDVIRRISKQEVMKVSEQMTRNNAKVQSDIQKIQQKVDTLWKATKLALQESSSHFQKETSDQFQIILGGIKKAMVQIQKQIKNQVISEVSSLPSFHTRTFTDITQRVNKISEHVFRAPYERQKPLQIAQEVKQITKQIEVFNQCNMTLFHQLNKIKSTVSTLQNRGQSGLVFYQNNISAKSQRPQSASPAHLQFKRVPRNRSSHKSNQNLDCLKISEDRICDNFPTIAHFCGVVDPQPKTRDQLLQTPLTYQVDSQGRLQDSSGNYLMNEEGQHVLVKEQHMNALRNFNMLIE